MDIIQQSVTRVKEHPQNRQIIAQTVKENIDKLFKTICLYVQKAGIASGKDIAKVATECLNEVVERGLRHADRFDPKRQAEAWLLGIAAKVILQEKHKQLKHQKREPFLEDMLNQQRNETIDHFKGKLPSSSHWLDEFVASKEQYTKLIHFVPEQDRELLTLSIIEQYTATEIAEKFGSTSGAIRIRLHRVLKRLRNKLEQKENHELISR